MDNLYKKIFENAMYHFKNDANIEVEECIKRGVDSIAFDDLGKLIFINDLSIRKHIISRIKKGE